MKINKLTLIQLRNMPKSNIPMVFISNLMEGNKEVVNYLPEIELIDKKIARICRYTFEKMERGKNG